MASLRKQLSAIDRKLSTLDKKIAASKDSKKQSKLIKDYCALLDKMTLTLKELY